MLCLIIDVAKLDGFLRPHRGSGDDWEQLWSKFTVLAEVSGWDTESKMMARFPLFIEGPAFLVFSKMAEGDKKKKEKVQELMLTSFSLSKADAYCAFQQRLLRVDETPDDYVADLRRLLALAGYATPNDDKDAIVVEQLLSGLPKHYAKELRLSCAGKEKTVSGCWELVRALREGDGHSHAGQAMIAAAAAAAAAAAGSSGGNGPVRSLQSGVVCHFCRKTGHVRKHCPERQYRSSSQNLPGVGFDAVFARGMRRTGGVVCHFCDEAGHAKKHCEKRREWMKGQKTSTAAAGSSEHASASGHCLCIAQPLSVKLPRVFVDVDCDPTLGSAQLFVSVIDTGSTRTLVTSALMDRLDVEFSKATDSGRNIVSLDGSPLPVQGVAKLVMSRINGPQCPVVIPAMSVEALVLPELSVVAADVLIGSDFVASCGGLHLEYSCTSMEVWLASRLDARQYWTSTLKLPPALWRVRCLEACVTWSRSSHGISLSSMTARTLSCQWMMVRYDGAEVKDIGWRGGGGPTAMPLVGTSVLELLSTRAPGCLPSKRRSSPQLLMSG